MMTLIEKLKQIAEHDWRVSLLAHTADTAREAADEIERLREELKNAYAEATDER